MARHQKILGYRITPLDRRRWANFRANKRGWWGLMLFLVLFGISLLAEFIFNDQPLLVSYKDELYAPVFTTYSEQTFGGFLAGPADYRDPFVADEIEAHGWILWAPYRYSYKTVNLTSDKPFPSPPDAENWLGTDDSGRDVLARLVYGFRLSVFFGLTLTLFASLIGISAGAVQGYFGGWLDLVAQRVIEIWQGLPYLFVVIILSSFIVPNFWWLLSILLLFSWMSLVAVVRAEFLRARNFDFVRAAKALGLSDAHIMFKHVLPNAMVAALTMLPFVLSQSIIGLTTLDYLGLGLPAGSPSLGELLRQGKNNIQAPWLGITAFITVSVMLTLLVFIGEAVRDAMDPRKLFGTKS